jgi:hypothetical protein
MCLTTEEMLIPILHACWQLCWNMVRYRSIYVFVFVPLVPPFSQSSHIYNPYCFHSVSHNIYASRLACLWSVYYIHIRAPFVLSSTSLCNDRKVSCTRLFNFRTHSTLGKRNMAITFANYQNVDDDESPHHRTEDLGVQIRWSLLNYGLCLWHFSFIHSAGQSVILSNNNPAVSIRLSLSI